MSKKILARVFFLFVLFSCNQKVENITVETTTEKIELEPQDNFETIVVDYELEYLKTRDRYVSYFQSAQENNFDQDILDKQDSDSLLVLEKILKEILKEVKLDEVSKKGRINLETLQPDMGFGGLDGLVINKNNVIKNAPQLVITTQRLFFDYFKRFQIQLFDSLTVSQLDQIFTSAVGRGEVRATTYSIVHETNSNKGKVYGCIGSLGQESGEFLPPNNILVLALNDWNIYILIDDVDESVEELRECKIILDSLNSLSNRYSTLYDESTPKDGSLLSKAVDLQNKAWKEYCNCYQSNLKDEDVYQKLKNQVIRAMQNFEM